MSKKASPEQPSKAGPVWSAPVAVDDVPESGRRVDLVADAPTRDAIAKAAGLAALPRLEAGFDLTRLGADGLRVAGRVAATIVQNCVVTLEPIESEVHEPIDLLFLPDTAAALDAAAADGAAGLQPTDADPPEQLRDGVADLGALAAEFLLLGIDPYPRKPGAVFDVLPADDPASHPFAALAALKKSES